MTPSQLRAAMMLHQIPSTRQLAIATGLNYQSMCMWIRGKRNIPKHAALILTAHFEVLKKQQEIDTAFDNFKNGIIIEGANDIIL